MLLQQLPPCGFVGHTYLARCFQRCWKLEVQWNCSRGSKTGTKKGRCWTHLTLTIHADAAVTAVFAGSAVSRCHHQLPLAIGGGAVEVAGVTGDVNVVIWRAAQVKGHCLRKTNTGNKILYSDTAFTNIFLFTAPSATITPTTTAIIATSLSWLFLLTAAICVSLLLQPEALPLLL